MTFSSVGYEISSLPGAESNFARLSRWAISSCKAGSKVSLRSRVGGG